jgi:halimadienyl-diphosphate synthase
MESITHKTLNAIVTSQPRESTMQPRVQELLKQIGPGKMSDVAYDTAWIARLGEIDWELSSRALAWLNEHQLRDGSWGAQRPLYYHDRVICTLAAMIALTQHGRRAQDKAQIERGLLALEAITDSPTLRLRSDANGATVGFEMIVPTLVAQAESLGLIRQRSESILDRLGQQRKTKLNLIKGKMVNRHITVAFSAEMAGEDGQHMLDIENLQEKNGSVGCSPSATAYFAIQVKKGDKAAMNYLRKISKEEGGVPNVSPFDTFETAWTLWNLSIVPGYTNLREEYEVQHHVNTLSQSWNEHKGAGFSSEYSVNDSDETAFVYDTLSRYGVTKEADHILGYEEKEWFRCFDLESNPSISANIHILSALRQAGLEKDNPSIRKILGFLQKMRSGQGYWKDKWHISPYYTTAHAIIACAGFANELALPAIEWMTQTQHSDGSWGYQFSSAEETAYCIQALEIWRQHSGNVSRESMKRAFAWLQENSEPPYPPLWIGKGLYAPELVARSAILSALLISEQD